MSVLLLSASVPRPRVQNKSRALYANTGATLDDLREAVATLEETARTAGRVLGGAHPLTEGIEESLWESRAVEARREAMLADGGVSFIREAMEAMTSGTA